MKKINGDANQPTDQQGEYRAICLFEIWDIRKKAEICNYDVARGVLIENNCKSLFEDGVFPFGFLLHQAISEKGAECVFPGLLYIWYSSSGCFQEDYFSLIK